MKPYFFLSEEEHKGILFVLSFILGIVAYFSLPFEPNLNGVISLFLLSLLLLFIFFFKQRFKFLSLILFFFVLGAFVSKIHTSMVDTKFLKEPLENADIIGTVTNIDERPQSLRLTLENVVVETKDEKISLNKVRMWASKKLIQNKNVDDQEFICEDFDVLEKISNNRGIEKKSKKISTDTCIFKKPNSVSLKKGDLIRGKSFSMRPPSEPSQIGGYYEARSLFFEGIEAVGSFATVLLVKENFKQPSHLDSFKHHLKERLSFLKEDTRGVIQALLLGDTNFITAPIEYLYRSLGLTHILSVSGFHVGLLSFLIYYFMRLILTVISLKKLMSPFLIRSISAVLALIVSFFYVLLTGAEPPAVRAFIMTGFIFLCFFINRQTLSVRTVFIAAFLLLCYKPVLILSAGFQLSFMAVLALCVLVKNIQKKMNSFFSGKSFFLFMLGLFLLNILVTFVSFPFIAYHFHKIPLYGIIGNLILSFVFSLVIMPLLVLGIFFMPFQLDGVFFGLAEQALFFVHLVGEKITQLPYLMLPVSSFSVWGLLFFSFGFILFSCMNGKLKYIGIILIVLFPFSFLTYPKSDIKIGREGRLLAVKTLEGNWRLNESYIHKVVSDNWLLSNAQLPEFYIDTEIFRPDSVFIKDKKISFEPSSCMDADLTFELTKKDYSNCQNLISKEKLKRMGTLDLMVKNGKLLIIDFSKTDENRPWNQKKKACD